MAPGGLWRDQATQLVHADPEMPLMLPASDGIETLLIILPFESAAQLRLQRLPPRPRGEEPAIEDRVENSGVAREIFRQARRRRTDIDDQVHKLRIGLEHRE